MIREVTEEITMKAREPHHTVGYWIGIVIFGLILKGLFGDAVAAERPELPDVVRDAVENKGAIFAWCDRQGCINTADHQLLNHSEDREGFYLFYPEDVDDATYNKTAEDIAAIRKEYGQN